MYFKVEQDNDVYVIMMTDKFYNYTLPYYNDSYNNIMYRLFNLLPKDFYHYIGFKYKAQFKKSQYLSNFVKMSFKRKESENAWNHIKNKGSALCCSSGV